MIRLGGTSYTLLLLPSLSHRLVLFTTHAAYEALEPDLDPEDRSLHRTDAIVAPHRCKRRRLHHAAIAPELAQLLHELAVLHHVHVHVEAAGCDEIVLPAKDYAHAAFVQTEPVHPVFEKV